MKSKIFENVFKDLKNSGINACIISSAGGVPIAWFGTEKKSVELYSTLSAAIMSASKILHSESSFSPPEEIISRSNDSLMVVRKINEDSIIVVMSNKEDDKILESCKKASKELRGVMK